MRSGSGAGSCPRRCPGCRWWGRCPSPGWDRCPSRRCRWERMPAAPGSGRRPEPATERPSARSGRPGCAPASSFAWALARSAASWSSSACCALKVCCASVSADTAVLLAGLRGLDGLIGLLLGQPRRRLLVDLLGAGALQVGDHLLGTDRQRLPGGRGVEDVDRIRRGQIRARRPVDIHRGGERVEALLGGGDRGVGVLDPAARWRRPPAGRRRRRRGRSSRPGSPC